MSKQLRNIFDLGLSPRMMIEASAGTGKTYTIVGLFVRLLIEKKLPLDQILVVTFTRMATKELKDRITARLRESLSALESGNAKGDDFLEQLVSRKSKYPEAELHLRNALRNFDDAQVHTIHGFCQKVLKEEALLTGSPFEVEVSQTDDLLLEAAFDFWRSFVHQHSRSEEGRYYLNKVFRIADTPRHLLRVLDPLLRNSSPIIEGPEEIDVLKYLREVIHLRRQMKKVWFEERNEILRRLIESNISGLGEKIVNNRGAEIDAFLQDEEFLTDTFSNLGKTTTTYLSDDANLTTKGNRKPEHRFFDFCDTYKSLIEKIHRVDSAFLLHAAESISEKRNEKAETEGFFSYDDLLNKLDEALNEPDTGGGLARKLQQQYPFALVDEFQDTDPVQYRIFDRMYSIRDTESSLLMIGDPKQAIYAFRGADVYTYLNARDGVADAGRYTLQRNFRSSENLVNGINALFSHSDSPFIEEDIRFFPSEAGLKAIGSEYLVDGTEPVPIRFQIKEGIVNTSQASEWAFDQTARQVAALIARGQRGEALIKEKKLTGGDIAILIPSHKDAEDLKQRLHNLGVDAVTYSRENVFGSAEASRLEMLMTAVLDPADHRAVQNGLVTGFFGNDLYEIHDLQLEEKKRQDVIEWLSDLKEIWQKHGFYPAFRKLMLEYKSLRHFTALQNSERVITNLQQLAELSAFAERDHHLDAPSLLNWFRQRMTNSADEEEETLRLESDQDLVKISTIHNSKGLEFPVVFCPALWYAKDISKLKPEIVEYHDTNAGRGLILNVDQSKSAERKKAIRKSLMESVAEEVRKAYVALTRAKYECRIFWTAIEATPYSGMGAYFIGNQRVKEFTAKRYRLRKHPEVDDQTFIKAVKSLVENYPSSFCIDEDMDDETMARSVQKPAEVSYSNRKWEGRGVLQPAKKLSSFSSLVHHQSESIAEPDYDQWLEEYLQSADQPVPEPERLNIFSFPRGAAAGTVIHKLFEHEKFDFRASEHPVNKEIISEVLSGYGMDEKWVPVLHLMMEQVCKSEIGSLRLSDVAPADQLREMEFHIPVEHPDIDTIRDIIRNGKNGASDSTEIKNYLTGFIDLIVRQNGKYYIIDYKSNHLGDSLPDYSPEALKNSIESAGYDIQYHFYILALVNMLQKQVPDFEYDKHFGGAAYLYIRGMKRESDNGVWFHKPEEYVIRNLQYVLERKV